MTDDQQHEVEQLLDVLLDLPEPERAARLASMSVSDEAVRGEVQSLLDASVRAGSFLERVPLTAIDAVAATMDARDPLIGTRIGAYIVDESLAAGGMGTVYRAHRADAAFEKQVALKVLRRGLDTDELLARFRAEQHILASLDHPNIARLLDAGQTHDGRPFFVMELVEGTMITEHARARELDVPARVDIFIKVCAAVQHAHSQLAIHRDLKPANIMMTADGEPKLLDFGIAKLLEPDDPEAAITQHHDAPMTLRYAAPEQVRGEYVQTATDVYSLGLVLYELLADRFAYDELDASSPAETRRHILETSVQPPSACTPPSSVGQGTKWHRHVSGDLDTIVLKALRKDPGRRYPTVDQFAEDLRRYRNGLPVLARPDTATYRLRKFVGRHAVVVSVATLLLTTLLVGSIVIAGLLVQTRAQHAAAVQARDEAEAVISFLNDLLTGADPYQGDANARVRDILDQTAGTIESRFADQPLVLARVQATVGDTYTSLGLYDEAALHLARAHAILTTHDAAPRSAVIDATTQLSRVRWRQGRLDEAESLLEDALRDARETHGETHGITFNIMNQLGLVKRNRGALEESVTLHEAAVDGLKRIHGSDHADTLVAMNDLALVYQNLGRLEEAESLLLDTLERRRTLLGDAAPLTLTSQFNLAALRQVQGRLDEALELLTDVVDTRSSALGDLHPIVLADRSRLAGLLASRGDLEDAERLMLETLEHQRALLGDSHPDVLGTCNALAALYRRTDRASEAAAMLREAVRIHASLHGPDHRNSIVLTANLASAYMDLDRDEEALPLLEDAVSRARRTLPSPHRVTGILLGRYGACLAGIERGEEAEAALLASFEMLEAAVGSSHPAAQDVAGHLCDLYERRGDRVSLEAWSARRDLDP